MRIAEMSSVEPIESAALVSGHKRGRDGVVRMDPDVIRERIARSLPQIVLASKCFLDSTEVVAKTIASVAALGHSGPRNQMTRARNSLARIDMMNDAEFISQFRVSRALCDKIVDKISPLLPTSRMSAREQLLITLQRYAHATDLATSSAMFQRGSSTIASVTDRVTRAVLDSCGEIEWPSAEEQIKCAAAFQERCGLPGIVAAVDGSLIPVHRSADMGHAYIFDSRKSFPAVVLQVSGIHPALDPS